tara:strand:+ start:626 stop:763 length:138 start_codon:yes stop_codon:yes gene_type:complete
MEKETNKKENWEKPDFNTLSLENTEAKTFPGEEQFMGGITNREPS